MPEAACWPREKAERRYAGDSQIGVKRVLDDDGYARHILDYKAGKEDVIRASRKLLMGIFTVVMAFSVFVYSVVPYVPVILLFRTVHGMAFAVSSTASLVLVSECVPESRMAEGVSYYSIMSVVSMAAGQVLEFGSAEDLDTRFVCWRLR